MLDLVIVQPGVVFGAFRLRVEEFCVALVAESFEYLSVWCVVLFVFEEELCPCSCGGVVGFE